VKTEKIKAKTDGIGVSLTQDEVKFIVESVLNCPFSASVRDMPKVIAMAQGVVKKLQPQPKE
jgi:hypothetical protein